MHAASCSTSELRKLYPPLHCQPKKRGPARLELDVPVGDALAVAEVQRHDELLEEPARQVLRQTPAVAERLRSAELGVSCQSLWHGNV